MEGFLHLKIDNLLGAHIVRIQSYIFFGIFDLIFLKAKLMWASTVFMEIFKCSDISILVNPLFLLKIKTCLHFFGSLLMQSFTIPIIFSKFDSELSLII